MSDKDVTVGIVPQEKFNAAMLVVLDSMAKVIIPIHEEMGANNETYGNRFYGENAELLVTIADIIRFHRDALLATHKGKLDQDYVDALDALG